MWRIFRLRIPVAVDVTSLQGGDHPARFVAQRARLVERAIIARPHEAAVALEVRQFVGERRIERGDEACVRPAERGDRLRDLIRRCVRRRQPLAQRARRMKPVPDRREVARPAACEHEARKRARQVGRRGKAFARLVAQRRIGNEPRDGIEPLADRVRVGERGGEALREQARARRGHRAVDRGNERAAPFARQRPHQFEIGAGRRIDQERRAGCFAQRRRQRRALADLRALHIGDAGGRRREFEAGERAERFGRCHGEIGRNPSLRARAVEHVARERRDGGKRAQIGREFGIAIERVRHDHLARLDAGDLGGKPDAVAFGQAKLAGRNVEARKCEPARLAGSGSFRARDRDEIVVALGVEERVFGERAGRDKAHHVAADDRLRSAFLRLRRVFQLLADGDAMAERDEAVQILVGALDRHAAHRDVVAEMLAALGQHDAERAARHLGVVEEQFVEIAHPVEQKAVRIGRLDLDILLHHRRWARAVGDGCARVRLRRRGGASSIGRIGHVGRSRSVHRVQRLADGEGGF